MWISFAFGDWAEGIAEGEKFAYKSMPDDTLIIRQFIRPPTVVSLQEVLGRVVVATFHVRAATDAASDLSGFVMPTTTAVTTAMSRTVLALAVSRYHYFFLSTFIMFCL